MLISGLLCQVFQNYGRCRNSSRARLLEQPQRPRSKAVCR